MTALPGLLPLKPPPPPPACDRCDHPDCGGRELFEPAYGADVPGLGKRTFCRAHRESGPQVLQERAR